MGHPTPLAHWRPPPDYVVADAGRRARLCLLVGY